MYIYILFIYVYIYILFIYIYSVHIYTYIYIYIYICVCLFVFTIISIVWDLLPSVYLIISIEPIQTLWFSCALLGFKLRIAERSAPSTYPLAAPQLNFYSIVLKWMWVWNAKIVRHTKYIYIWCIYIYIYILFLYIDIIYVYIYI